MIPDPGYDGVHRRLPIRRCPQPYPVERPAKHSRSSPARKKSGEFLILRYRFTLIADMRLGSSQFFRRPLECNPS